MMRVVLLFVAVAALALFSVSEGTTRKTDKEDVANASKGGRSAATQSVTQTTTPAGQTIVPTEKPATIAKPSQAPKSPQAGSRIDWHVIGSGGGRGVSPSYAISGTLRQTAVGNAASPSYHVSQGFWQPFTSSGCCVGTTGNADGSPDGVIDISDIFAIIAFLSYGDPLSSCPAANDVNRDGTVDISDIFTLIDFLVDSIPLPACPV